MLTSTARASIFYLRRSLFSVFMILAVSGCAVLDLANPKPPTVKLDSIKPKKLGGAVQQLELGLLIQNPNRFDLRIQGVDFTALVNGERLASGSSNKSVNVPGLGKAVLEVQLALGLNELFSQATRLLTSSTNDPLVYGVKGTVDLENWPVAIPFDVDGEYANPLQ